MIKIEHVNKIYTQGKKKIYALRDINLSIPKGAIFGVIGSSGAGKSTLIRCVNLLERPSSGAVIVDDIDLTQLSHKDLTLARRKLGMIFQHFNLLSSRTVFANVAFPLELAGEPQEKINARVNELLKLVGLEDKVQQYPANLSGGQKQRVAIARALATSPKVLLCDEATSALDPATTKSILVLLKRINKELGITILIITHEMDVVKNICSEVAIIGDGELVEKGSISDIFAHPKTQLAKEFIHSTLDLSIPDEYAEKLSAEKSADNHPLVRLEFTGNTVNAPIISEISQKYQVAFSILSADMDYAGGMKFGIMLAKIIGESEATQQAIESLYAHKVQVEVLGYVD